MPRLLVLMLTVLVVPAHADVLNVPSDFTTIQAAVDAAQDGDEIVLAPGTYESPDILIDRPLSVTIRSTDPADPAIVAATVLTDFEDDTLLRVSGEPGEVIVLTLDGLTIRRSALRTEAPLIECTGAALDIVRCMIEADPAVSEAGQTLFIDGRSLDTPPTSLILRDTTMTGDLRRFQIESAGLLWERSAVLDARLKVYAAPDNASGPCVFRDSVFARFDNGPSDTVLVLGRMNDDTPHLIDGITVSDTKRQFLQCGGAVQLRDVRIERSGAEITNAFINADVLDIDGLTVVDCATPLGSGSAFGIWFINAGKQLVARNTHFENNTGADIWLHGITRDQPDGFLVEDSVFLRNEAVYAVLEAHGSGVYRRCTFDGNTIAPDSDAATGTLSVYGRRLRGGLLSNSVVIDSCVFRGNSGGLGAFGAPDDARLNSVLVRNSIFEANSAVHGGAASIRSPNQLLALIDGKGWITFQQCVFVGNMGGDAGVHFGSAAYESCVLIDNLGSIASLGFGSASTTDTIIVHDASEVPTVADTIDNISTIVSTHSIVPPDAQGTSTTSLDPLFIRNPSDGGDGWGDDPATPDVDESLNDDFGDLRLRPASPAIDAGSRGIIRFFETDLDGNSRLRDDPGIPDDGRNGRIDIGAYEFQGTSCLADVTQDGFVTPADFNAWILAYNNGSPLADQTRDGRLTPADFNAWIINFNATFAAGCPSR